jgi:hypothetical protein
MEAKDSFAPVRPVRFRPALGDVAEALMQAQGACQVFWVQDWVQLKEKSGVQTGRMRRQTNEI